MRAELADGRVLEFPDGTDPSVVQATVRRLLQQKESPTSPKNLMGAAIEPLATMASGAVATPLAGILGTGTALANVTGLSQKDPAEVIRNVQSTLTYQPKTEGGQNAMSAIGAPFEYLAKGAKFAGEKVHDVTGNPALAAQVETVANVLPGALGMKPGGMPAAANASGAASRYLMQSALKPNTADLRSGAATKAVQTLLDEGVNPTRGGVRKLEGRIADVNDRVTDALMKSYATVKRDAVATRLDDVRGQVGSQVAPSADLAAVEAIAKDFGQHPSVMSVQEAQALKRGTYRQLADKYGEMGSASTEAQKALARGLKEEIATAVPEIAPLNARETALIQAKKMAEHRSLIDANKNPMGMTSITPNLTRMAVGLADRSAVVKALLARLLNPGKGMDVTDASLVAGTMPQSFTEDMRRRQKVIDAMQGR